MSSNDSPNTYACDIPPIDQERRDVQDNNNTSPIKRQELGEFHVLHTFDTIPQGHFQALKGLCSRRKEDLFESSTHKSSDKSKLYHQPMLRVSGFLLLHSASAMLE